MELNLAGKRALVTGSTLGIGRAIAESLLNEGAEVVINSRDADRVRVVIEELKVKGSISGVVADLSSSEGVDILIEEISNIDILINNAGFFEVKPFFEIKDEEWFNIFELNVMSGVRLSRALMQGMLDRDWGRIIFIGSDQSSKPNPAMMHYAMTKTAQVSVARGLAELTKGTNVTVNTVQVAPTWTDGVEAFLGQLAAIENTTVEEMSRSYFEEGEGQTSLLQRWAKPEEIANVVAFLCSPKSSAINGAAPRVDGGIVRSLF